MTYVHTCNDTCWLDMPLFKGKVMANKAVFLDRDRTLIEDPGYIADPGQIKLLPGVDIALKSLSAAGFKIVVVTNQSGIARGMLTEETLEMIHDELRRQLGQKEAFIDAIYYCPFHPEGTVEGYIQDSELRKPRPGMLLKAAADMEIDLGQSWMVGDSPRDIEAGQRAHCRTILIRTRQQNPDDRQDEDVHADFTVRNMVDAARIILRDDGKAGVEEQIMQAQQAIAVPVVEIGSQPVVSPVAVNQTKADQIEIDTALPCKAGPRKFSVSKFFAGVMLSISVVLIIIGAVAAAADSPSAMLWLVSSIATAVISMTLYIMQRD